MCTFSSPSGEDRRAFSSCSGVGSASPEMSFPKTWKKGSDNYLISMIKLHRGDILHQNKQHWKHRNYSKFHCTTHESPTWDVISRNTRSVSDSQFLCWATLAEIWPAILMLSPSFHPRIFTCRTLSVFSGPFNSILMMWLSPPGSSLVTQPICLESKSTY